MKKIFHVIAVLLALCIAIGIVAFAIISLFYGIANADELLVSARSKIKADPVEDRRTRIKKGYVVAIHPDGWSYTVHEGLPNYVIIKLPSETLTLAERGALLKTWKLDIDYEVVTFSAQQDGYRIRVFSKYPAVTDQYVDAGKITLAKIQTYIEGWNGQIFSYDDNEVVFDIGTYQMATSDSFWKVDVSDISFSEVYKRGSGIHTITADYSGTGYSSDAVETKVRDRQGNIISHDIGNKIIVFDIQGTGNQAIHANNVPLQRFKTETHDIVRTHLYRRRAYIQPSVIDLIIENYNGIYTTDKVTLMQYVIDRLTQ